MTTSVVVPDELGAGHDIVGDEHLVAVVHLEDRPEVLVQGLAGVEPEDVPR